MRRTELRPPRHPSTTTIMGMVWARLNMAATVGEGPPSRGAGHPAGGRRKSGFEPSLHHSQEQYPAEHSIDSQSGRLQHKTNPCGGDQLAQMRMWPSGAGQGAGASFFRGLSILNRKDLVPHDPRQIEAHHKKGVSRDRLSPKLPEETSPRPNRHRRGSPAARASRTSRNARNEGGPPPCPIPRSGSASCAPSLPNISGGRPAGPLPWLPPATPAPAAQHGPRRSTERPCFSNSRHFNPGVELPQHLSNAGRNGFQTPVEWRAIPLAVLRP